MEHRAAACAQRTLHEHAWTRRVTLLTTGLLAAALILPTWFVLRDGLPRLPTLLLLVAVAVVIQHRDVLVVQLESAFDAGIAVAVASVVIFRGAPAGPMLIGLAGGLLFVPQLRARAWGRLAGNAANFAISAAAAALLARAVPGLSGQSFASTLATGAVAGFAYWATNDALGLLLLAARDESVGRGDVRRVFTEDARLFPLALLGAIAAHAHSRIGWWLAVVLLAVAPVTVEWIVVHRRRARTTRRPVHDVVVATAAASIARELTCAATPEVIDAVIRGAERLVDQGAP